MTTIAGTAAEQTTLGKIIALTDQKRDLEAQLRVVKEQLEPLHTQMLDEFASRGETSARHAATGKLVYINRRTWARPADGRSKDDVYDALVAAGLEDYAERGFNTQKLSAYFRELIKQSEENGTPVDNPADLLPEQLAGLVDLTTDHIIAVRS